MIHDPCLPIQDRHAPSKQRRILPHHHLGGSAPARHAFTLVELMVVIGIITLLISIAVPAIKKARDAAKFASTSATIRVLEVGLNSFRAEGQLGGEYPPSVRTTAVSPHDNSDVTVHGANLLVWAMAGADLLGTPGFRDLSGTTDPFGGWIDDTGTGGLYQLDANGRPGSRFGPYVDIDKMKFSDAVGSDAFRLPAGKTDPLEYLFFLDAFDQPILYYKANIGAIWSVDAGNDDNGSNYQIDASSGLYSPTAVYNLLDNLEITGYSNDSGTLVTEGIDFGAGQHPISRLGNYKDGSAPDFPDADDIGTFAYTMYNPNVTATCRPHNVDTFTLLSAGVDGLFGTADDVANFEVNK